MTIARPRLALRAGLILAALFAALAFASIAKADNVACHDMWIPAHSYRYCGNGGTYHSVYKVIMWVDRGGLYLNACGKWTGSLSGSGWLTLYCNHVNTTISVDNEGNTAGWVNGYAYEG